MTRTDFDVALKAAGLSRVAFSQLYGVHVTTVSRWGTKDFAIPQWVTVALADRIDADKWRDVIAVDPALLTK